MNREGAKFCAQCATPLPTACASCGSELGLDARFCDQCGTPVGEVVETADTATRKVVTILFADLVGSTSFGEQVDAESAREAMAEYYAMAQESVEAAGGTVAKFIGDGVMALFGVPETLEDDAERAIAAGLALQRGFGPIRDRIEHRHSAELGLRVGINTGEIVLAEGDADLVGDAINTAARLEAACTPGEVLVGEETWRLTRYNVRYEVLGEVEVKGKHEPVATYRVLDDGAGDDDQATPFVGRNDELAQLQAVFDEATSRGVARLVTVIGAPGVGKTRISHEFCEALGDSVTVAVLRCERAGTATFAPIADLLRGITSIDDESDPAQVTAALRELVADLDDADRVADLLASFVGAAPARSTEEAFLAVRRLVEAVGRQQPLVVVVDDIQWAEPLFLDLLEHLAEWVSDAPAVLVGLARPELRDQRPALAEPSRWLAATIALEGLDAAATAELAARLVGADSLPPELVARLPDSTEGNPLFVRELMRMLVDDGVIVQTADGWQLTIDAEAVEVPPTIQSLLAARLDRMPADERRLVELASVVGPEFALGAVGVIADGSDSGELRRSLERLRRRELIESTGAYWGDEPIYRFHHVLIRDAAYRRLLKRARADLHLRVGEWTERTAADLPGEHEVAIAFHYEQAHEYRRQLDDVDEQIAGVGRRAAKLLGAAAERALERDDLAAASTLAERSLARLDEGDPQVAALLVVAAEALLALGDVAAGRPVVERLSEVAGDDARLAPWAECFVAQLLMLTEPDRLHDAEQAADRAATRLAELGDEAGVAKARLVRAVALARLGQVGQCEAELDLALTAARSAGDRRRVAAVLGAAPVAALWGPSPIPRAGGRCLDVIRLLRITTGSPAVEATSVRCQAVLEALRGRFDTARSMLADSRATVEELGLRHGVAETDLYTGIVELLAGEPAIAEPPLRAAYRDLDRLGIGADAGQAAAYLARALLWQGHLDEADELAARSAELAGENPQTAITARTVQAEILAARGDLDGAVAAAAEAVARAEGTDIIVDHANASAVLAWVARQAGDAATADRAARSAAELYEQKAATVRVETPVATVAAGVVRDAATGAEVPGPESGPWNDADRLARRFVELFTAGAREEWLPMLSPDQVTSDRRPLVGVDTAGADQVADAYPRDHESRELSSTVETLAVRGEAFALVRWKAASTSGREWDSYHLSRWTADGLNDLNIIFPPDQLAEAVEELDRLYLEEVADPIVRSEELTGERATPAEHEPWSEADRLSRQQVERFFDPSLGSWEEVLAPGYVGEDRRRVVGHHIADRQEVIAMWSGPQVGAEFSLALDTIATRGDHLVLFELIVKNGEFETQFLEVQRWFTPGLLESSVRFDVDQLAEAVEELERLYLNELGDTIEALHVREFGRAMTLLGAGDVDAFIDLHDPSFVMRDHRQLGWADVNLDEYRARMGSIAEVAADALVVQERVLRLDHTSSTCATQRIVFTTPDGPQQISRSVMVMIMDPCTGLITLMEQFEEDQVDEAVERFDELMAERGPVLHNEASQRAFFINGWLRRGDDELVAEAIAGEAPFVDEHGETFELAAVDRREVMAVRGERLALVQVSGPDYVFAVEEIDNEGKLVAARHFGPTQLVEAVTHLDRRWLEIAGEEVQAAERVVTQYQIALNQNALTPLAELLADDHALVDRRPFGWPALDRVGVLQAAAPGQWADQPTGVLIISEILATSQSGSFGRTTHWTAAADGTTTQGMVGLVVVEVIDARVGVVEMFAADDFEAAMSRFNTLGSGAIANADVSAIRSDAAVTVTEVLMALADSFCLSRVDRDGTAGLLVTVTGEAGQIIETVEFGVDAEAEARRELNARWIASLSVPQHQVAQLGASLGEAWVAPSSHSFDELLPPSFELLDGRTLGMGRLDRDAFEEALRGREADGATRPPVVSRVTFVSDDVMVFRAHNVGVTPESGVGWEEIACNVMVVEDGRIARLEMFDEDQWDDAITRAVEVARPSRRLENSATRHVLESLSQFVAGSLDERAFTDDYVREDRRRTVSDEAAHRDRFLASMRTADELGGGYTAEPLAIRGDRFGLCRIRIDWDADRVTEFLLVNEVADEQRVRRTVHFDLDDIESAFAELGRLWEATLPPAKIEMLRFVERYGDNTRLGDDQAKLAMLADDFVAVDRRLFGFGEVDRQFWIEYQNQQRREGPVRFVVPEVFHLSERVFGGTLTLPIVTEAGSTWEHATNAVFEVSEGRVVRHELFEEAERDAAIRRAQELDADGNATSRARVANAASRTVDESFSRMNDGKSAAELIADGFRRDDRRRHLPFPEHGADELKRQLETNFRLGAKHSVDHIAVRGERLVLSSLTTVFEESESVVEMLVLAEFDAEGRILVETNFETDRLAEALTEIDDRWMATLDPADAETYRIAAEQYAAYVALDADRLDQLTAEDLVFVDRRTIGFGEFDRVGFFEMFETRRSTRGPGRTRVTAVHLLERGVLVSSTEEYTTADGDEGGVSGAGTFLTRVRGGRVDHAELFDDGQIEAAMARGREFGGF